MSGAYKIASSYTILFNTAHISYTHTCLPVCFKRYNSTDEGGQSTPVEAQSATGTEVESASAAGACGAT